MAGNLMGSRVFVVHGEKQAAHEFARDYGRLGLKTIVPRLDEVFELTPNTVERLGVVGFSEARSTRILRVIKVWGPGPDLAGFQGT